MHRYVQLALARSMVGVISAFFYVIVSYTVKSSTFLLVMYAVQFLQISVNVAFI